MSVTAARGFSASGIHCGIKRDGALDLAVVAAPDGTVAAAMFTTNVAAAAPVIVSRRSLEHGSRTRAVVLNSGCANAATGAQGMKVALAMQNTVANAAGCPQDEVLVCSTGSIGSRLDLDIVTNGCVTGVAELADDDSAGHRAAEAILTTDTVTKTATVTGDGYTIGAMAKGAGMIRPDMATMLAVITTDAVVDSDDLHRALAFAVDESFHGLNVDGCPSTNDTVIVMASGASDVAADPDTFATELTSVCVSLADQIASDAEGANRVVAITVTGAADDAAARAMGRTIADSALVRASFYGGDPNWGRVIGALGTSTYAYDPEHVGIVWQGVPVAANGEGIAFDEDALIDEIASGDFSIEVSVGNGSGRARVLTTDLTPEYAAFNGERS